MAEEGGGRTDANDRVLVTRVLDGDRDAYGGLVARYQDQLGRYAMRMLGNAADAEEALQDAFVRGYRYLGRCSDPDRFGAWLFGILVNRCRTYGARKARQQKVLVPDVGAIETAPVSHTADDDALRDAIGWALEQISPDQREAFLLKHVEDLSYEEMRDVTGAGIPALKMRVLRAREALRRLLEEADSV